MRDFVLAAGLAAMLPYVIGRPHVGVLLWAWTALVVPNALLFGFARTLPFNFVVAVTTLTAWLLSSEKVRIPLNGTVVLLLLLALLGAVSSTFGIGNHAAAWGEWEKMIKAIVFALVVSALITSRLRFLALTFAIILSLGFLGFVEGLKVLATGGSHRLIGPGNSMIADNNHFALAILCTIPLVFFAYQQTTHALLRMVLLGIGLVLFFTIVGTFSRGGLIGLMAMGMWAFVKSRRKVRYVFFVVPIIVALAIFAPSRWFERMDTITNNLQDLAEGTTEQTSFMGRVVAWKQSTLIALDNPILGGGFHAVQDHSVWNLYRLTRFDALSFITTPDPGLFATAAHSIYFQIFGDLGFSGLALFAALAVTAFRNSSAVIKTAGNIPELAWAAQLALCLQYSLIAYYISGAALSMAYFELIYVFFAMLTSLRLIVEQHVAAQGTQANGNRRA